MEKTLADVFRDTVNQHIVLAQAIAKANPEEAITFDMANYCERVQFMDSTFAPIIERGEMGVEV